MCANFRRTTRALTQLYENALRPLGLRATQFTILQALSLAGEVTQSQLGGILAMDSTTLTRTLAPLRRKGWLRSVAGTDRREVRLSLTAAGRRQYLHALPYWRTAQRNLQRALGSDDWNHLIETAVRTAEAMTTYRNNS